MFDPTAFDNIKTVLEGSVYDLDLSGDITITGRQDSIDMAVLSRRYSVTFFKNELPKVNVQIRLEAALRHLASELLGTEAQKEHQGAVLSIQYSGNAAAFPETAMETLRHLWGTERLYERRKISSDRFGVSHELEVTFNRLITEEMMEDLEEMLHFIVDSLHVISGS
ncbi:MAG TPA: hypothetical protein VEY51_20795 [Chondromyces sp.]|nr:hypothetical protein [Chondromyces sp.]